MWYDFLRSGCVVIHNHFGEVKVLVAAPINASYSVEIDEMLALIRGCEVAWNRGFADFILETDNANIVVAVNNNVVIKVLFL
ncbi:hypothetical protein M5689_013235 [Euphorbia peplus]|nr:hypothetical protein M5689_013235 [Euphorbia peplus]